jgi:hypothetical protein
MKPLSLFAPVLALIVFLTIYVYLDKIPTCNCYSGKKETIDRMKLINSIMIVAAIVAIINIAISGQNLYVFPIISILYSFYFALNATEFLNKVGDKCDSCAGATSRYLIWGIDAFYIFRVAIFGFLGLLILFLMLFAKSRNSFIGVLNKDPAKYIPTMISIFISLGLLAMTFIFDIDPNAFIDPLLKEGFEEKKEGCSCNKH